MGAPPLSPPHALHLTVSEQLVFTIIPIAAVLFFAWIVLRRFSALRNALPDRRFDRPAERVGLLLQCWLLQWKHPRYLTAGLLHIVIFVGFLVLSVRSLSLVMMAIIPGLDLERMLGPLTGAYAYVKDYASTAVFAAVLIAGIRRVVFKPARYAAREGDTHNHTAEALAVLSLIALLMLSESIVGCRDEQVTTFTLAAAARAVFANLSPEGFGSIRFYAYAVHELTFFSFLCLLPLGKHFHVLISAFNIYFAKLDRGRVKPARWDVPEDHLDQIRSLGVRNVQDFTWKHILDFYSCADCGRCSDNCPATTAGRPLSPRFLTIKGRDACFNLFPLFTSKKNAPVSVRSLYADDEIWSCTTCGACEEECPMQVEYIDKVVDLRRALVEDGAVPASLQKPLKALESRSNPFGKLQKKRADWTKAANGEPALDIRVLNGSTSASTLFFVDSVSSYDDRIQRITRATARILSEAGESFGILGEGESDSGHDVRRFGEESLFQALRQQNSRAIQKAGVTKIVTADPHAFNALRHDYNALPPVEHMSEFMCRQITSGNLPFTGAHATRTVVYHDPCYLGRHNLLYDQPRTVIDAIPGIKRVEMKRCRDRSFCCGGGGLMLNYEASEKVRIGALRLQMACDTGADTIVTACPFCLINLDDAIKVAGIEQRMRVLDITELVLEHMTTAEQPRPPAPAADTLSALVH